MKSINHLHQIIRQLSPSIHAPPMHTDTLHTWCCTLGRYENWPQRWLWIVMPACASMVTPKEHKHEHTWIALHCFWLKSRQNNTCSSFVLESVLGQLSFNFGFVIWIVLSVTDAYRALELLEDYHSRLTRPQDRQLRSAIEKVIETFKSRLFQALIGKPLWWLLCHRVRAGFRLDKALSYSICLIRILFTRCKSLIF